jgi:hypothetical protein
MARKLNYRMSLMSIFTIYLLSMVVCLFVGHIEISQTMTLLTRLLVLLGSPPQVGVNQGDFIMFRPMAQELLNIELFCQRKFSKLFLIFNEICDKVLILLESL